MFGAALWNEPQHGSAAAAGSHRVRWISGIAARRSRKRRRSKHERPFDQDGHREQGQAVDPWESKAADLDPAPDSALQTVDTPEPNNPDGASDPKANATGKESEPASNDPLEASEKGQGAKEGNDALSDASSRRMAGRRPENSPHKRIPINPRIRARIPASPTRCAMRWPI